VGAVHTDLDLDVAFSSGRTGSGPATWGQHAIWDVVRTLGSDAARYNVSGGGPLNPPVPLDRAREALQQLFQMHDSLRTRLRPADGGGLEQVVHAAGTVSVVLRRSALDEAEATAHVLLADLAREPFDCERAWPVRIGIVESDGLASFVVFTTSHTASDGWGLRHLVDDMVELCASGPTGAGAARQPRLQPLEEAAFQTSERGRRRDESARRHWRTRLAAGPRDLFPGHRARPGPEKFPNALLNSPALDRAMGFVAAEQSVSRSAVLLAATAATACRLSGTPDAVFQLVINNRFLPGLERTVSTVAQEGLFRLPEAGQDFADVVKRAYGASLATYQHAYYDKLALDRDIARLAEQGAAVCDHSCFINDTRGLMPAPGAGEPDGMPLAKLTAKTTLAWPVEFEPRVGVTFALDALDAPDSVELAMTADGTVIPRADMERFLLGIEELVVGHALALGCP
jgi:hypothetical protein